MTSSLPRIRDNPFYVLGLRPTAARADIEREGAKLLGMLELGLKSASTYATPVGPGERTAEKVRQAMALLRDPSLRLEHELWAKLEATARTAPIDDGQASLRETAEDPWPDALVALGWSAGPR